MNSFLSIYIDVGLIGCQGDSSRFLFDNDSYSDNKNENKNKKKKTNEYSDENIQESQKIGGKKSE